MLDLKAIAAARGLDIPQEQLERIAPVLQKLDEDLRRELGSIPDGSDSAINFRVHEDAE